MDPFPVPAGVPVTIIAELRAERRAIEEMLDPTPYISQQPASLRIRRNNLCDEIERLEKQGDGGPLLTVTLDAYASAVVRRIITEEPDALVADVVNAALIFTHGESDDHDSDDELAAAIERRLDNTKEVA